MDKAQVFASTNAGPIGLWPGAMHTGDHFVKRRKPGDAGRRHSPPLHS